MKKLLLLFIFSIIFILVSKIGYAAGCQCDWLNVSGEASMTQDLKVDPSSSTLYVDSVGNKVGIGTTTLYEMLEVNGNIRIPNDKQLKSPGHLRIDIDTDNTETDRVLLFTHDTGNYELMRVQENGNVGIGATTLSWPLGVYRGTAHSIIRSEVGSDSYISALMIKRSTGTTYPREWYWGIRENTTRLDLFDNTANGARISVEESGNVGIGTESPSSKLDVNGAIEIEAGATDHKISDSSGNLVINSSNTGGDVIIKLKQ